MSKLDPITLGILWDRLISITDQIVSTLEKCSFSLLVREGGDLSCLLFDAQGRSLAQGTFSSGAFIGTGPLTLRHMLEKFPPQTLKPGDVIMIVKAGHLNEELMADHRQCHRHRRRGAASRRVHGRVRHR